MSFNFLDKLKGTPWSISLFCYIENINYIVQGFIPSLFSSQPICQALTQMSYHSGTNQRYNWIRFNSLLNPYYNPIPNVIIEAGFSCAFSY